MNKDLLELIACPVCGKEVGFDEKKQVLICTQCGQVYPVVEGVPEMFAPARRPLVPQTDIGFAGMGNLRSRVQKHRQIYGLLKFLLLPDPVLNRSKQQILPLIERLGASGVILEIGSGSRRLAPQVVNLDVRRLPLVDIMGMGENLPFLSDRFDAVIAQAVLEHVADPRQVVAEIGRVLKPSGYAFIEVPFMQGFHASPWDYQRFTISGLKVLFADFEIERIGISGGASSALAWILKEWLSLIFSFGFEPIYQILSFVFGWMVVPLKFVDILLNRFPRASAIASSYFLLVRKR